MQYKIGGTQVDIFTWHYIVALFWMTPEDEFPEYCYSGEFSISEEDAERLAPETLHKIIEDCQVFQDGNELALAEAGDDEQNGHDFALTRNRSGVGFWDRGYEKEIGDALTTSSHQFGEFSLYLSNENMIWGE